MLKKMFFHDPGTGLAALDVKRIGLAGVPTAESLPETLSWPPAGN